MLRIGERVPLMTVAEQLCLRVDGSEHRRLALQYTLENEPPTGASWIVIKDDHLGTFVLTDECRIELKEESDAWEPVTLP